MLHISREEQRERLLARLDDPTKQWKYNPGDLDERGPLGGLPAGVRGRADGAAPPAAPWYVVPADRKWYRNWAVATLLRQALADIDPRYPRPDFDVAAEREKVLTAP